ncbi:Hpt domain-containing protein [Reinekea sp.]|jgi:HPt (histidine-containing phosphotransfer) domain-containing protein|uniref:Hpt domain-containing protein n=1 Tax=Reinekea sp. TaxID=1970455 RepID=UPI003989669C
MFDKEVLKELQELLEDDFVGLIEIYLRDLKVKVPEMGQYAHNLDFEKLSKVAHSLKGASINLGIGDFGKLCGLIEQAARQKKAEEVTQLLSVAGPQAITLSTELSLMYLK